MIRHIIKNTQLGITLIKRTKYSAAVEDHYKNPRNVGTFDKNDKNVGTGLVGAPACGDVLRLQVKIKDGKIIDTVFKTFGCASAIASSSLSSEMLKGCSIDDALNISNKTIASYLKLPPVKKHCSLLAEDAIKVAINEYKKKNNIQ